MVIITITASRTIILPDHHQTSLHPWNTMKTPNLFLPRRDVAHGFLTVATR